jgi:hypothetical protein
LGCALALALLACKREPPAPVTKQSLMSIWGSGSSDVWAVGASGTIVHYDGKTWSVSPSGTTKRLSSVAGSAPNDVWAVGEAGTILRFDGKSWSPADIASERTYLNVASAGPRHAYVAGLDDDEGILRHNRVEDEKTWENMRVPSASSIWRIWAGIPNQVWLVGNDADSGGSGIVLRGYGKKFERVKFEGGGIRGIFGTASNDIWVSTYDGHLQHWDDNVWTPVKDAPNGRLLGLWGANKSDVWAVGFDGLIVHYDGKKWTRVPTHTKEILWSIWGSSSNDVWVAGNAGTLLHWDGKAFGS